MVKCSVCTSFQNQHLFKNETAIFPQVMKNESMRTIGNMVLLEVLQILVNVIRQEKLKEA